MNEKDLCEGFLTQRMIAAVEFFFLEEIRELVGTLCIEEAQKPEDRQNFDPASCTEMFLFAAEKLKNQLHDSAKDFTQLLMLEMESTGWLLSSPADLKLKQAEESIELIAQDAGRASDDYLILCEKHGETPYPAVLDSIIDCVGLADNLRQELFNPTNSTYPFSFFTGGEE